MHDISYTPEQAVDTFAAYYRLEDEIRSRVERLNALSERFDTLVSQGHRPNHWASDGIKGSDLNKGGEWSLEFTPGHDLSYVI